VVIWQRQQPVLDVAEGHLLASMDQVGKRLTTFKRW